MDCSVLLLRAFIPPRSVCIAHNNCMSCPSIWATLSALLINILLGSFQLFLHSDRRGWNNPVQRCLPVGEAVLSTLAWLHALTDRPLRCATDDDQRQHHHAEHHFQFSISHLFVYFASFNTLTHLHVSNCRVRQLQFFGIFVALGL